MNAPQLYDGELQMFVEEPRQPNQRYLEFLRWLAERGRLEHRPVSAPMGPFALTQRLGRSTSDD
jgi:hypothetical protein